MKAQLSVFSNKYSKQLCPGGQCVKTLALLETLQHAQFDDETSSYRDSTNDIAADICVQKMVRMRPNDVSSIMVAPTSVGLVGDLFCGAKVLVRVR